MLSPRLAIRGQEIPNGIKVSLMTGDGEDWHGHGAVKVVEETREKSRWAQARRSAQRAPSSRSVRRRVPVTPEATTGTARVFSLESLLLAIRLGHP